MSRDLPTFDSVWLDALVQSRVLTAFQAQSIETNDAQRLTIGPCVILDRLGASYHTETFLARHRTSREPCVIKQVTLPVELAEPTLGSLKTLIAKSEGLQHPRLIVPQAASLRDVSEEQTSETPASVSPATGPTSCLNIVSSYCEALSLSQLILRRGRVPAETVLEIARQLLDGLSALHARKLVHGDVSLQNSLLARNGQVVLVDCGVRPALQSEFQINSNESPERYDGIAPELIGTGRACSPTSDLYAVGCLLWHLLAGRSAFPTGDPLARLAAHQTERIPDIREVAPETPDSLAEAVLWLTEPDFRKRPREATAVLSLKTAAKVNLDTPLSTVEDVRSRPKKKRPAPEVRVQLGIPRTAGRRVLSQFAQSFQHPALQTSRPSDGQSFTRSIAAATVAMLLAGVALFQFEPNSRRFLQLAFPALASTSSDEGIAPEEPGISEVRDLPSPDDFGVIELPSAGPWRVRQIEPSGSSLTIRSTGAEPARLIVESEPLDLRASEITLERVHVEHASSTSSLIAMCLLQCQQLTIRDCRFLSDDLPPTSTNHQTTHRFAIGWEALDSSDRLAGQILIENSVLVGSWSSIWLSEVSRPVVIKNSLKSGSSPLFVFEQPATRRQNRSFVLENVTLRNSGPIASARLVQNWLWETQLHLTLHDCIIDPETRDGQPRPLFIFEGEKLPRNWQTSLSIDGSRSFVRPGASLVGMENGADSVNFTANEVEVRGLSSADFMFAGELSALTPETSVISDLLASRRTSHAPGIHLADGQLKLPDRGRSIGEGAR